MKQLLHTILLIALCPIAIFAQNGSISGELRDDAGEAVAYANVALYYVADSTLAKVETTDETGQFAFNDIAAGDYLLEATYVGLEDLRRSDIQVTAGEELALGTLSFVPIAVELETALVTAQRAMVEVKPDRTVFNVQGTINSTGGNGMSLLRKAPGVTVDNNDNISVLGRAGVLVYVDGKRLPINGEALTNYLQNLPADQIDRIDIISNPGAKYEAEGNAGIIDIRLKRDKNMGSNGSVAVTGSQGQYFRGNVNASGNYRNRVMNAFATAGVGTGDVFNNMDFLNLQRGLYLDETVRMRNTWDNYNYRFGADFFLGKKHIIGALISGNETNGDRLSNSRVAIATQAAPSQIDSILFARNTAENSNSANTYNINYRFDNGKGNTLNFDADYGRYRNTQERLQPNRYFDASENNLLTEVINFFDTPTDIDIYTLKLDYTTKLLGGNFETGAKYSQVETANDFLLFNVIDGENQFNDTRSNLFNYDERVYAGYISYNRPINEKWNLSLGLRAEQTDATGDLIAFRDDLMQPPVELNYLNWFPNIGLTWQVSPQNTLAFNYGRRINRPDYNVLNPFENQLSEISFEKGNPFLQPEIVNNIEVGYTLAYRYNFKLAYSRTTDQITRLIAPDDRDSRAGFITWANLSEQTIYSFNASLPFQFTKGWSSYFNLSASYLDNQADYGDGAIVDVQAFNYSVYQQQTINLPGGFKGEISGWFTGPGVWGGVFEFDPMWSLSLGLQKKFFKNKLNARLSFDDVFYESGWDGVSEFDGLISTGRGRWDSRRAALSLSYNFGNQNVKSRKRKTGLEAESQRVSSGE